MARTDAYYDKLIRGSIFISDKSKTTYIKNMQAIRTQCGATSTHDILTKPCMVKLQTPFNKITYTLSHVYPAPLLS